MKKFLLLLIGQLLSVLLLSLVGYLARPVNALYVSVIFFLVPLFSAVSACWMVLKGLNPYLTWILPPIGMTAAAFLSTLGIGQSPLPMMISAFVSLIGAATGDTIIKTRKKNKR